MPDLIRRSDFAKDDLPLFANFNCGDEPWEQEVADWICNRVSDGVLRAIKKQRCRVFKYRNAADEIIGFGALGESSWSWPKETDPRQTIAIIPWLGLDRRFRGMPNGYGETRYSDQIVADIIYTALDTGASLLGLFVHPRNVGAIKVYARNGFEVVKRDVAAGDYLKMIFNLASLRGQPERPTEDIALDDAGSYEI